MAFRVAVVGRAGLGVYPALCAALDAALVNRLPDVEVLAAGGPGLPALAASYARSRGLPFVPFVLDTDKHPGNPSSARNVALVEAADAVVACAPSTLYDAQLEEVMKLAQRKGIRVLTLTARVVSVPAPEPPAERTGIPGLPD